MRKMIFAILAVFMLSACTVNNDVDVATPREESQSSEDAVALLPSHKDNLGQVPPSVVYETLLDKGIHLMEDDTVSVRKTRITKIEKINDMNPDESIIAGMKLDYYITFEDSPEVEVNILAATKRDTRIFRWVNETEKQFLSFQDLKVGQLVEVHYFYPTTPLYLAIEIVVLEDKPVYINEKEYEGVELEIVKQLNRYIKAIYENDFIEYNNLLSKDHGSKDSELYTFSNIILSIHGLEFTPVVNEYTLSEKHLPIVIEMREKNFFVSPPIDEERQLFVFQKEEGEWKLLFIADWW